jgi:hypothetical protein
MEVKYMASWMVHFRIADKLLDYLDVNAEQFIVGNIGPDCGEPNEDWSIFYPSTYISHWNDSLDKAKINSEGFYQEYIEKNTDRSKLSFYLGYYVHLKTDILWSHKVYKPTKARHKEQFEQDDKFIWTVKEDWYDLDHKYLRDNPNFRAFRIFDKITVFPNIYLDYFSDVAMEKQIRYISDFYNAYKGDLDREYLYLNEDQVNAFVVEAVEEIKNDLIYRNLIGTSIV